MGSSEEPAVRPATPDDVAAICRFGEEHVAKHYAPLIGDEAADAQVRRFWNDTQITRAVTRGLVVVAEREGRLAGVGQRGRRDPERDSEHVIYKLYVHPGLRGHGIGPRLIDALTGQMDADTVYVEHFVENERAARFYEREGFEVERIEQGIVWRSRPITRP
jgi:ribosomal protein S18 acetylase RimI-like enzyme